MDKELITRTYNSLKEMNLKNRAEAIAGLKRNIDYYNSPMASEVFKQNNHQNMYNALIFLRWVRIYKII